MAAREYSGRSKEEDGKKNEKRGGGNRWRRKKYERDLVRQKKDRSDGLRETFFLFSGKQRERTVERRSENQCLDSSWVRCTGDGAGLARDRSVDVKVSRASFEAETRTL